MGLGKRLLICRKTKRFKATTVRLEPILNDLWMARINVFQSHCCWIGTHHFAGRDRCRCCRVSKPLRSEWDIGAKNHRTAIEEVSKPLRADWNFVRLLKPRCVSACFKSTTVGMGRTRTFHRHGVDEVSKPLRLDWY